MNKGKIVQVLGPVVDVEFFEGSDLPRIKDALEVDNEGRRCVMETWGDWFIRSFLNEGSAETAFKTGMDYVRFISFFYVCIGLKATTDGLLRGAGDVVVFTAANLVNLAIRVSVAALLAPVIGVQAVWFAVPMGWTANYIISFFRYLTGKWERIRLIS